MQHDNILSDIDKISEFLDHFLEQERQTNTYASIEIKKYVQSKLEESFLKEKNDKVTSPVENLIEFSFIAAQSYILNQKEQAQSNLKSTLDTANKEKIQIDKLELMWEETKTRISLLGVNQVLEALRINFERGFGSACQYLLEQKIPVGRKISTFSIGS